ncbi:MAG: butyrate kinase [Candidatus Muiribacterium halophilum]|uniref:Probable butyrate kinase n=1 Tax=Muiribacterium halophilum TaxID=2053465 RepID=A0A2N5ZBY0_MUIH1|nr:MAG: butyrate kinase [Candidatus Muirbacterium halophilum]
MKILAINPGSTSTKIAIYNHGEKILSETLRHSTEELKDFENIIAQFDFRTNIIKEFLSKNSHSLKDFDGIIGRGGLLKPIESGLYKVSEKMLKDLRSCDFGEHASNLGGIIAQTLSKEADCDAFIADPVVVDEMDEIARVSGIPEIERISIFHALNQKAVAKRAAKDLDSSYEDCNFIVVHLGGGISVGAHKKGRVVDVNNALDGDGPFSQERSGGVPIGGLVKMCFSGKYTLAEIKKKIKGKGGLVAYMGTNNATEVEEAVTAGDEKAYLIYNAMAYQVSKEIGALAAALKGEVDAIILTGGIAYDKNHLVPWIKEQVEFIAQVLVYPGEDEMKALHEACQEGLKNREIIKEYR